MKWKPAQSAAENARAVLPRMARKFFEAGRKAIAGDHPPDELHRFRLRTKRFRYTLELFQPLYGPGMEGYLKSLRQLQGALGKVSDYRAIRRVLSDDRELKKQIDAAVKGKLKDVRRSWRAFDSAGELKRWRAYLGGVPSQRATKRASTKRTKPRQATKKPPGMAGPKALAQAAG